MADTKSIGIAYRDQAIEGGTLDNTPIGATTASTGAFTTLSSTGTTSMGNAAADLVGMHGVTAVQSSAITAVGTSVPVAACATFGLTSTQLTAIVTGLNAVIVALAAKGITA